MCVCVCARARACARACVRCVRACVRACVRVCVRACVRSLRVCVQDTGAWQTVKHLGHGFPVQRAAGCNVTHFFIMTACSHEEASHKIIQ